VISFSDTGFFITRRLLGLPDDWGKVRKTFDNSRTNIPDFVPKSNTYKKKCPEIPRLKNYSSPPSPEFWKKFPKYKDLEKIKTPVNTKKLKLLIEKCKPSWSIHEIRIAEKTLVNLTKGTTSYFKTKPKPIKNRNATSAIFYGEMITDAVAHWLKKRYAAGPFDTPPFPNMCISPLMASKQKNKIRPILNLSAPEGNSVNECMDAYLFRKLEITSARKFGQGILLAGKNAKFGKTDLQDAYKLLPCNKIEHPFFGFQWLDKVFVDISTPFGSRAAPSNFDDFGETLKNIVKTETNTKEKWIFRQLDDLPVISPENSEISKTFTKTYKETCKNLNIPLAENCPLNEKAFDPTTKGTVLGIEFDSEKLSWKLPKEKFEETLTMVSVFLNKKECFLLDIQKLLGKLNDFGQMHTFCKGFKYNQNNFVKSFQENQKLKQKIPEELKKEISVWAKNIIMCENGMNIPLIMESAPFIVEQYISDAAGPEIKETLNSGFLVSEDIDSGMASIGFNGDNIDFVCIHTWPKVFLKKFASKSAVFECIGLLAPLLMNSKNLKGKHICLEVDNTTCVYAWENRVAKNDEQLAILIQTMHILENLLTCKIYVKHTRRRSNKFAVLVDNCSRISSTKTRDLKMIEKTVITKLEGPIVNWIENPVIDWDLPLKISDFVMSRL